MPPDPDPDRTASAADLDDLAVLGNVNIPMSGQAAGCRPDLVHELPPMVRSRGWGLTERRLARYRSPIPLLAFTPEPATRSQLALSWGVETALLDIGRCQKGDQVVIVAGSLPGTPGRTNALRVHRIGDAIGWAGCSRCP